MFRPETGCITTSRSFFTREALVTSTPHGQLTESAFREFQPQIDAALWQPEVPFITSHLLCIGRESNPGQLHGKQLCSPLYHQCFKYSVKSHSFRHLLVPLGERYGAWTKCVSWNKLWGLHLGQFKGKKTYLHSLWLWKPLRKKRFWARNTMLRATAFNLFGLCKAVSYLQAKCK